MASRSGKLARTLYGVHRMSSMLQMTSSMEFPVYNLSRNALSKKMSRSLVKVLPNEVLVGSNTVGIIRQQCLSGINAIGGTLQRYIHASPYSQYSAGSAAQINQSEFTDMAWEAILGSVDAARQSKQQVVETEHLMKALLEQRNGLARRIFTKAGIDNTSVLQATDQFIYQQPKVVGDTTGPLVSTNLMALLEHAKDYKKEFGDEFLSVEHMVLAFLKDKRFGQQLFKDLQLSAKDLKDAVQAVRGQQKVTDQNPEGKYESLEKYGNDLTELARQGKLDPVIGRDDEIRRCIQILSRRTKNNPVIIGEPGVGKTAIAEGYYWMLERASVLLVMPWLLFYHLLTNRMSNGYSLYNEYIS